MPQSLLSLLRQADKTLADHYSENCVVIRQMLKKYRKIYPNAADYSMLRTFDVCEISENLMGEENQKKLSGEDLYVFLMAAAFLHVGLGAGTESGQLVRKYADIFEFPQKQLETRILNLLDALSSEDPQKAFSMEIPGKTSFSEDSAKAFSMETPEKSGEAMNETDRYLLAILQIADRLAELVNRNPELDAAQFPEFDISDIRSCVEHLSVESIHYGEREIVIPIHGSETVYALLCRKTAGMDTVVKSRGKLIRSRTHFSFPFQSVHPRLLSEGSQKNTLFLNPEIEKGWSQEDHLAFDQFSEEESEFYLNYLAAEYGMTKCIREFADTHGVTLEGLEFRVKSPKSVYGKLHKNSKSRTLDTIADTLRYTVVSKEDTYTQNCLNMLELLTKEGWKVFCVENYWLEKRLPYNGVNMNLRNKTGFLAEIQFHTPDSFRVKMSKEDHGLYEKRRLQQPGSPEYEEILRQQFALYAGMPVPAEIERIAAV